MDFNVRHEDKVRTPGGEHVAKKITFTKTGLYYVFARIAIYGRNISSR